jgi:hypothetical protein
MTNQRKLMLKEVNDIVLKYGLSGACFLYAQSNEEREIGSALYEDKSKKEMGQLADRSLMEILHGNANETIVEYISRRKEAIEFANNFVKSFGDL